MTVTRSDSCDNLMNLSHMENPIVVHLAQVLTGKVTILSTTQKTSSIVHTKLRMLM